MVNLITPSNIDNVLNEVIKKLDEAEMILGAPGCSNDSVGEFRCDALNSVKKAHENIEKLIHKSYILR